MSVTDGTDRWSLAIARSNTVWCALKNNNITTTVVVVVTLISSRGHGGSGPQPYRTRSWLRVNRIWKCEHAAKLQILQFSLYAFPDNRRRKHYVFRLSVRLSVRLLSVVCRLTRISRDAISLYLVDGFQWNLTQIFIMWVSVAELFSFQSQRLKVRIIARPTCTRMCMWML